MVRSRVDRAHAVCAGRETSSDVRAQLSALRRIVQALEERKLGRVCYCRLVEGVQKLDCDVRMANDGTRTIDLYIYPNAIS